MRKFSPNPVFLSTVACGLASCATTVPPATVSSTPAVITKQSAPSYPLIALATCTTGFAQVQFDVDELGAVQNAVVMDAQPSAIFNDSAIAAVSSWRFRPRVENGSPIATTLTQKIDFAAPDNCIPFDTEAPGDEEFDEDTARNACFASGANQWGYAELYFVVGPDGLPVDVRVHRTTAEDLSVKARAALSKEQFEPRFVGQTLSRVLEFCSR
ncbi:MAG: energy transducer TonB [Gammaproteobacteria bacterium]